MKLKGLMDEAYRGKVRGKKRLDERRGEFLLGFEDLVDRLKERPKREEVEALVPQDVESVRDLIISAFPGGRREEAIWGYLTSIAAERAPRPWSSSPATMRGWSSGGES